MMAREFAASFSGANENLLSWRRQLMPLVQMAFLAAGCMVGPDFKTPEAPVATNWIEKAGDSVKSEEAENRDWWGAFNDPALTRLIEVAYQQNLTVQAAGVRVLEARARLGMAIGEFYPQQQQAGAAV